MKRRSLYCFSVLLLHFAVSTTASSKHNCIEMTPDKEKLIQTMTDEISDFLSKIAIKYIDFDFKFIQFDIEGHSDDEEEEQAVVHINVYDCAGVGDAEKEAKQELLDEIETFEVNEGNRTNENEKIEDIESIFEDVIKSEKEMEAKISKENKGNDSGEGSEEVRQELEEKSSSEKERVIKALIAQEGIDLNTSDIIFDGEVVGKIDKLNLYKEVNDSDVDMFTDSKVIDEKEDEEKTFVTPNASLNNQEQTDVETQIEDEQTIEKPKEPSLSLDINAEELYDTFKSVVENYKVPILGETEEEVIEERIFEQNNPNHNHDKTHNDTGADKKKDDNNKQIFKKQKFNTGGNSQMVNEMFGDLDQNEGSGSNNNIDADDLYDTFKSVVENFEYSRPSETMLDGQDETIYEPNNEQTIVREDNLDDDNNNKMNKDILDKKDENDTLTIQKLTNYEEDKTFGDIAEQSESSSEEDTRYTFKPATANYDKDTLYGATEEDINEESNIEGQSLHESDLNTKNHTHSKIGDKYDKLNSNEDSYISGDIEEEPEESSYPQNITSDEVYDVIKSIAENDENNETTENISYEKLQDPNESNSEEQPHENIRHKDKESTNQNSEESYKLSKSFENEHLNNEDISENIREQFNGEQKDENFMNIVQEVEGVFVNDIEKDLAERSDTIESKSFSTKSSETNENLKATAVRNENDASIFAKFWRSLFKNVFKIQV